MRIRSPPLGQSPPAPHPRRRAAFPNAASVSFRWFGQAVSPAQAGFRRRSWTPAFAGMTVNIKPPRNETLPPMQPGLTVALLRGILGRPRQHAFRCGNCSAGFTSGECNPAQSRN